MFVGGLGVFIFQGFLPLADILTSLFLMLHTFILIVLQSASLKLLLSSLLGVLLERLPSSKDFLGLNVLNSSQLISIIFVSTERVKSNFLAESLLVLFLYDLKNVVDLLTVVNFVIVNAYN